MPRYRNDRKSIVAQAVKESKSIAGVIRKMGLIPAGGNYDTINKLIIRFNLDTSHFTGPVWNRGVYQPTGTHKSKSHLRAALIRDRGPKCQHCRRKTWCGRPIPLEMHHIDGIRTHNDLDNLLLLCPNCHAQTDTYRNRNIGVGDEIRTHKGISPNGF